MDNHDSPCNHGSPWIIMSHHGESAGRKQTKVMLGCILGMNMHQIHRNPMISVPVESPFKNLSF